MIVERIFISHEHGAAQIECEQITLQAGKGIIGDRSFGESEYPGQNITLTEAEEIELFNAEQGRSIAHALPRRKLITRGLRLNSKLHMWCKIEGSNGNAQS